MFIGIVLFIPICLGLYLLLSGLFPRVNPRAERAVNARAGRKRNTTGVLVGAIAVRLLPVISIEELKRQNLARTLRLLGQEETPELLHAKAWATGVFYAASVLLLAPTLHLLAMILVPAVVPAASIYRGGLLVALALLFAGRNAVLKELEAKVHARREAIEWELPQFSGTVLQSLGHTRNVIEILESYRKICSPVLKREIDTTLNDMRTGNHETAIKNLAARINSGAFTQLAQGLIGLLRGDDQRSYFQIITKDFTKAQHELIRKELIARPGKLTINNVLLLAGMMAMLLVAIGGYLLDSSSGLF